MHTSRLLLLVMLATVVGCSEASSRLRLDADASTNAEPDADARRCMDRRGGALITFCDDSAACQGRFENVDDDENYWVFGEGNALDGMFCPHADIVHVVDLP